MFLTKRIPGGKHLKYVLPIGTVMAMLYTLVSFKLATFFLFQQVIM